MNKQILKTLVGSHAHRLATEESDYDYKSVFVTPTEQLLCLSHVQPKANRWSESEKEDETAYELAHFLHLATRSNPTILEVFAAPVVESTEWGEELKALFPYVWSSKGVLNSFTGYSLNQRKKMLDDKYDFRQRRWKYAASYIGALIQGIGLLRTGQLDVAVPLHHKDLLLSIRAGKLSTGRVIDEADRFTTVIYQEYENHQDHETQMGPINEFLLRVRREYWTDQAPEAIGSAD